MKNLAQLLINGIANNPTSETALNRLITLMVHYPEQGYCNINDADDLPEPLIILLNECGFEVILNDINYGSLIKWPKPEKEEGKRRTFATYPDYSHIYDPQFIETKLLFTIRKLEIEHQNADIYIVSMIPKELVKEIAFRISKACTWEVYPNVEDGRVTICRCKYPREQMEEGNKKLQDAITPVGSDINYTAKDGYTSYRDYSDILNPRMASLKVAYQVELIGSKSKFKVSCKVHPRCIDAVRMYLIGLYGREYLISAHEDGLICIYNRNRMDPAIFQQKVTEKEAENKTAEEKKKHHDPMDDILPLGALLDAEEAYKLSNSPLWFVTNKIHDAIAKRETAIEVPGCFMNARVKEALKEHHFKIEKLGQKLPGGGSYPRYEISWNMKDLDLEENELDDEEEE